MSDQLTGKAPGGEAAAGPAKVVRTVAPRNKVAVALGGGGARGYAHIGVLQELAARGYEVARIAGTSMGAIVGALHSSGNLDQFTDWVLELRRQRDVVRLLDPNLSGPGAVRVGRILSRVNEMIGVQRIEELPIPFTAVATDLWARREVWFNSGPIDPALRASIAIPGVFPPIVLNGRLLVDGGVSNQVPVSVLASSAADLTVAVSLDGYSASAIRGEGLPVHTSSDVEEDAVWTDRLRHTLGRLMETEPIRTIATKMAARPGRHHPEGGGSAVDELFEELPDGLKSADVMRQSLEVLQSIIQRYQLASFPADALVVVPRDSVGTLDFHRAADQIALGRRLAAEAFDRAGMRGRSSEAEENATLSPEL